MNDHYRRGETFGAGFILVFLASLFVILGFVVGFVVRGAL